MGFGLLLFYNDVVNRNNSCCKIFCIRYIYIWLILFNFFSCGENGGGGCLFWWGEV